MFVDFIFRFGMSRTCRLASKTWIVISVVRWRIVHVVRRNCASCVDERFVGECNANWRVGNRRVACISGCRT